MQNTIQTTIYSKSAILKARPEVDDENVGGYSMMDSAKVSRALNLKCPSPKKANFIEEDELSTTASSGNESYGTTKQKKIASSGNGGKMDKWMMAQIWGLAAVCFMAAGFALLACAAAAMAIVLCCTRKDVAAPAQKSAPWASGPRSGAALVKKNLRQYAPTSGSKPRNPAPGPSTAAPQKMVVLGGAKKVVESPTHLATKAESAPARFATPPKLTSPNGPRISLAPNPASTAELRKLLATHARPVMTAAMRVTQQQKQPVYNVRPTQTPARAPLGLEPQTAPKAPPAPYTPITFRRELVSIMKELAQHRNAADAVRQVRMQGVPQDRHSAEFADILTRAMEERNGPVRRTYVAFAAGLAAGGESSAFNIDECAKGTGVFFTEVFEELCSEVPRLDKIVECELVPTLRAVFSSEIMKTVLPLGM